MTSKKEACTSFFYAGKTYSSSLGFPFSSKGM